ncbi:MAG: hypothetical protein EPO21_09095 [Chloroflexota bacterium]|nr:MAG: hypothetical protein EPO21_09095 [Chloroflexota bacterium]
MDLTERERDIIAYVLRWERKEWNAYKDAEAVSESADRQRTRWGVASDIAMGLIQMLQLPPDEVEALSRRK